MKNNRLEIILAASLAAIVGVAAIFGQRTPVPPPEPIPPTAAAMSCGQGVRRSFELEQLIEQFHTAGCNHIDLDYIADGFYLVRGTKILIGE